ncbi:hypothetical protein DPV78_011871 [Talaromyces pinophilus]|nr:hypothetical protein DPV78_011871 [Talaromyces pinophilus]
MPFATNIDAIVFFQEQTRHIRVYYQHDDDKSIREASYRQDLGWFVQGDGVVTNNAKANSPIAVSRWIETGGGTQIRVFYLDEQHNICECQGGYFSGGSTEWTSATIGKADELEIDPDTQLAVARPDKDDRLLRVFYQEKVTNGSPSASLREVRFDYKFQKWAVQDNPIVTDALRGTRLSAVSDKINKDVRLYYQGKDLVLREIYCHKGVWFPSSSMIQKQKKLVEGSPIAAVSWATEHSDLEIRVFTVLLSNKAAIAQFSHSTNWWSVPGPPGPYMENSAIACCRNTAPETADSNPVCVFYQPEPGSIMLTVFPADNSQLSQDIAKGIKQPIGIPLSRGRAQNNGSPQGPDSSGGVSNDQQGKSTADLQADIQRLGEELKKSKKKAEKLDKELKATQKDLDDANREIMNLKKGSGGNDNADDWSDMINDINNATDQLKEALKD